MPIIDKLAHSLGRKDENPNIALSIQISQDEDLESINQLFDLLFHTNKNIRHDAIKVVYEIGERNPFLIRHGIDLFLDLLDSKDNRMQWGSMTAIDTITNLESEKVWQNLPMIIKKADQGTVITRDKMFHILTALAKVEDYHSDIIPLMLEQLAMAPENQFPSYSEQASLVFKNYEKQELVKVLEARLPSILTPTKKVKIERLIKKLNKK